MPEFLKYLGDKLRSTYDKVVGKPLPWSMIDKLADLDERAEQGPSEAAGRSARPQSDPKSDGNTTR